MKDKAALLKNISTDVRALFHLLYLAGEQLHRDSPITIPQRAMLEALYNHGKQTIIQLAENRSVSRQFIQKNIEYLKKNSYVEIIENPEHRRSFFIEITPQGKSTIMNMLKKEKELFTDLCGSFKESNLKNSLMVLGEFKKILREYLNKK